jgi:hypothetical protein
MIEAAEVPERADHPLVRQAARGQLQTRERHG